MKKLAVKADPIQIRKPVLLKHFCLCVDGKPN